MNQPQKKPQGLGKGLSALMGNNPLPTRPAAGAAGQTPVRPVAAATEAAPTAPEAAAPLSEAMGGLRALPLTQLTAGKFQPRRQFVEEHLAELADSIEKHGVMQPIVVRAIAAQQFEIIAGERRWRASKMVGLETIPAIVRELSDAEALELALIENIQRADLNPLEEAEGYDRLMQEFHYTQESLSKVVGKSRSHIANLLRLLKLPDSVKRHLENGALSMGHARAILMASDPESVVKQVVEQGLSVRQAEMLAKGGPTAAEVNEKMDALVKRAKEVDAIREARKRGETITSGEKTEDVLQLENMLSDSMGLKVSINTRGGQAGDVVISYESLSQLDDILRRLGGGI